MSLVDDVLGIFGLDTDPVDVQGLIPGVEQGYEDAAEKFEQGYTQALEFLEAGKAEAADAILQGLGMSIDEREKWFDVATKALEPVIEYGKEYRKDARQFMDYAKELVFNPDAIYGTKAWDAYKGQIMDAVTNSASAKSGLLSGNYIADLSDRIGAGALNFRNSEISNAYGGFDRAMIPVQLGLSAQSQIANNAMNVGSGNASDIGRAYGQIGANALNVGTNMAQTAGNYYNNLGQLDLGKASEIGNLQLTQMLANQNAQASDRNALFGLAGTIAPYFMPSFGGFSGGSSTDFVGDLLMPSLGSGLSPEDSGRTSTYTDFLNPFPWAS